MKTPDTDKQVQGNRQGGGDQTGKRNRPQGYIPPRKTDAEEFSPPLRTEGENPRDGRHEDGSEGSGDTILKVSREEGPGGKEDEHRKDHQERQGKDPRIEAQKARKGPDKREVQRGGDNSAGEAGEDPTGQGSRGQQREHAKP
jgi:hypothetical protein